jgi:hypothetical protein
MLGSGPAGRQGIRNEKQMEPIERQKFGEQLRSLYQKKTTMTIIQP